MSPILLMLVLASGAAAEARLDPRAPLSAVERDAKARLETGRCNGLIVGLLWPGLGQICDGRTSEGILISSLAALEAGVAAGAWIVAAREGADKPYQRPQVLMPLVGAQDLWIYSVSESVLDRHRAQRLTFAPQNSLGELALAPFDPDVMSRPSVWLGIVGSLGLALILSAAAEEEFNATRGHARPEIFGRRFDAATGYPLAAGLSAALFTHVAIAEETFFRGVVQSTSARRYGEWPGFVIGTLVFGLTHLLNAVVIEPEKRLRYATRDVPFITAAGSYLGLSYMLNDYSLAPPVAIHFWYDLLLSMAQLLWSDDPEVFQVNVALPF